VDIHQRLSVLQKEHPMPNAPNANQNAARSKQEQAGNHSDKAQLNGTSTLDRARAVASSAAHKAKGLCRFAAGIAGSATVTIGNGFTSMGGALRQKGPHKGMMGTATSSVANALERGGRYLQEDGLSGLADDLTGVVRGKLTAARTEIREDAHQIVMVQLALLQAELKQGIQEIKWTLVSLVHGLVLLLLGSALFCFTAVHFLEWAFRPYLELWVCGLIVASVVVAIGGVRTFYARNRLRSVIAEKSLQYTHEKCELNTNANQSATMS
jgi:hypothetical protein